MRLRDQTFVFGGHRKKVKPVIAERVDSNNFRIGDRWFKNVVPIIHWSPSNICEFIKAKPGGVTIYYGTGVKRFIADSWYSDIDIDQL